MSVEKAHRVKVEDNGLNDVILMENEVIQVSWSPDSILPGMEPSLYYVDIMLFELDTGTGEWNEKATLRQRTENTGRYDIMVPQDLATTNDILPVAILVAVSFTSEAPTNENAALFEMITQGSVRVGRWSAPYYYAQDSTLGQAGRIACEDWFNSETSEFGQVLLDRVQPCPRTLVQARLPNSGVREVDLASFFLESRSGGGVYHDQSLRYFYPNAVTCFRGDIR